MALVVAESVIDTDPEGYLENLDDWGPEVAERMAREDGLELSAEHWEVIYFLREYYDEYAIAPAIRVLVKAIGQRLGPDKAKSAYLYRLFPEGPAKQACRYAGLPKPTGCV